MKTAKTNIIKRFRYLGLYLFIIPVLMAFVATGCGDSDDDDANNTAETGTLTLSLTDAASDEYTEVWITIDEVRAQMAEEGAGGDVNEDNPDTTDWEVIAANSGTYNLLELVNGMMEQLGVTELETGHYPQMRLYLGDTPADDSHPYANYVVDLEGNPHELFIPSGFQSGIKLVNAFDIEAGVSKELVLDFDVQKSIIKPGVSGKIILKPTIKVIEVINRPVVTGTVYEADGATPVPGAYVSAQIYDPTATDAKDRIISTGTITDDNGEYRIILEDGLTYNIVSYMEGYAPNYIELADAELNEVYEGRDINLSGLIPVTVPVSVMITGDPSAGEVQSATVSFQQYVDDTLIEVISENIEEQGGSATVSISLPAGTYDIASSSDGFDTQLIEDEVIDADYMLDVVF
ncbi:MAG: DUF4382 domain-containing protein [Deltaproteobacteria bacterium]|nr:DUF4382 domain-containing protein [Deltaproteobacteria bacterium]